MSSEQEAVFVTATAPAIDNTTSPRATEQSTVSAPSGATVAFAFAESSSMIAPSPMGAIDWGTWLPDAAPEYPTYSKLRIDELGVAYPIDERIRSNDKRRVRSAASCARCAEDAHDLSRMGVVDGTISPRRRRRFPHTDSPLRKPALKLTSLEQGELSASALGTLAPLGVWEDIDSLISVIPAQPCTEKGTGKLCVLAGHDSPSSEPGMSGESIYGLDLGWMALFQNRTYFFFGDTWVKPEFAPLNGRTYGFGPRLVKGTDAGDNNQDNDAFGYSNPDPDPSPALSASPVLLSRPLLTFPTEPPANPAYSGADVYSPLYVPPEPDGTPYSLGANSTPGGAFATDGYLYTTVRDPKNNPPFARIIARWIGGGSSTFTTKRDVVPPIPATVTLVAAGVPILTSMFANVAFARPSSFVPNSGQFGLPDWMVAPVFVWGRPSLWAISDTQGNLFEGATDLYLAVFDGDQLDGIFDGSLPGIELEYLYCSLDSNGMLIWHSKFDNPFTGESFVSPLPMGPEAKEVAMMTVTHDPDLNLWIMLYGAGATTDGGLEDGVEIAPPDAGDVGIRLRVAENPWGPWSDAVVVWPPPAETADSDNIAKAAVCSLLYIPSLFAKSTAGLGISQALPGPLNPGYSACVASDDMWPAYTTAQQALGPNAHVEIPGTEYAASIWPEAGRILNPGEQPMQKSLYFAMSTLNPYHVVLMKTVLTRAS